MLFRENFRHRIEVKKVRGVIVEKMIKELNIEPYDKSLEDVSKFLDDLDFRKVKTKYTKGDAWTAISFYGYGPETEDILKPGVLKSSVKIDTKLQYTKISDEPVMKSVHEILEKLLHL